MSPPMLSRLPASLLVNCGAAFELAILPEASQGQRMADLAAPWHITSVGPAEPSIRRYPATYYFEGAAIGGSLFATTGALLWYELGCLYSDTQDDCTAGRIVRAGLVGALVGATVGALVGGLVPAPYPRPLRGS